MNFLTKTEVETFIAECINAGDADAAEYDVAAIAHETYAYSPAYARWVVQVDEAEFWQIVEKHERTTS